MNISAGKKIRTGLFVLVSIGLLLVLLFIIGNHKNLFSNTISVYADFKNIAGTKEGNYVRFAGINIGTVESIQIVNDTTVRLQLSIEKKIQPYIKSNALASIGSDGLMGDKLIQIAPGTNDSPLVKDGGMLLTTPPVNVDKIMNNLARVADNAAMLTEGLSNIIAKVNDGKGSVGRLLNDSKLANNLETTIHNANETVGSIKKTANSVTENMQAAKSNFLLKGYFKKKERKRIKDSADRAQKLIEVKQKPKE
jgi:phospholipid/cholesterol/gamma-HCH transport system substrate-binding protein